MKTVTFTASAPGLGTIYNKGDVAVFPDDIADAIVAKKLGTAVPFRSKSSAEASKS